MRQRQMIWRVGKQRGNKCCGEWPIVRVEMDGEECEWHTAYMDRDDAVCAARDLNRAFREGVAWARRNG